MIKTAIITAIITILIILLIEYLYIRLKLKAIEQDAALMFVVNTPMCTSDLSPAICSPFTGNYLTTTDTLSMCKNVGIFIGSIFKTPLTSNMIYWSGDTLPIAIVLPNMILFRGTMTGADIMTDLQINEQVVMGNVKVHSGFNNIYQEIKPKLPVNVPFVAGHSLGCGLAALYAYDNNTTATLIAPPRTGNSAFAAAINSKVVSVINLADVVPTLPPAFIAENNVLYQYSHAGKFITFNGETTDLMTNHSTLTYYNYLSSISS